MGVLTKMTTSIKTYSELSKLTSFMDRYQYLRIPGAVGKETFGFDRYMNQMLYRSHRWKSTRDKVIIRDNGCDLGVNGREIYGRILIHHMNPVTIEDIEKEREWLFDPEFLICTTHQTHNAIHFSDERLIVTEPIVRSKNDTCPWRRN